MLLQLKIQIEGISKPPVWRKILVPDHFTFERLHQVIQAAFGWSDSHCYAFSPAGYGSVPQIGVPDEGGWMDTEIRDSSKIKISKILTTKGMTFCYVYDFGDDWVHSLQLEDVTDEKAIRATLVSGKGACPPEDCGGVWGYDNLVDAVNNTYHPEHDDMRNWMGMDEGETWDKSSFDLHKAQKEVAAV